MSRLMEKLATRAWKKNIDVIDRHPEYRKRLEDAGVIDYKRETDGLNRGTDQLAKKYGIRIEELKQSRQDRYPEGTHIAHSIPYLNDVSKFTEMMGRQGVDMSPFSPVIIEDAMKKQRDSRQKDDRTISRQSFGFTGLPYTKTVYKGDISRKAPYEIRKDASKGDKSAQGMLSLHDKSKRNNAIKDAVNALFLRHEIDEQISAPKRDREFSEIFSHYSPRVIEKESKNISGMPQFVRDRMKKIRTSRLISEQEQMHKRHPEFQYGKTGKDNKLFR